MDEQQHAEETTPERARKRTRNPAAWSRQKQKEARYTSASPAREPTCRHPLTGKGKGYHCKDITLRDAINFRKAFFAKSDKVYQDNYMLKYILCTKPSRVLKTECKTVSAKYFVPKIDKNVQMQVCKNAFIEILGVGKTRLTGVIKRHMTTGEMATEKRGGDRKKTKFSARRESVKKFIKRFTVNEIHYCRDKIKSRSYLSSDLRVSKMWRLYCNEYPIISTLYVRQSFFRNVFLRSFNLGFSTPRVDVCSTCLLLSEQIKSIPKTGDNRVKQRDNLLAQKTVHRRRYKAFFELLKEVDEGLLILCYDCQKNENMPRIPDQATYYSRQLYIYNFGITMGCFKASLNIANMFLHVWTEDQYSKGSNEVASTVYFCLISADLSAVTKIRLVADGCGGQNKNSTMIGMVSRWLRSDAPQHLERVELIFPVTGHSYMPPDRVLAQIEREIKQHETIANPDGYKEIFACHGTVLEAGVNYKVYHWKNAVSAIQKNTSSWHFKLRECKRVILTKNVTSVLVRGEPFYNSSIGVAKSLTKKNKDFNNMKLVEIPTDVPVKKEKLEDVGLLLTTHYGKDWRSNKDLSYFKEVLRRQNCQGVRDTENDEWCCAHDQIIDRSELRV